MRSRTLAHALKAALACLVVVLLFTVTAYADETTEANRLIAQVNALQAEVVLLDEQTVELWNKVDEIDPAAANAADALPLLADVETLDAETTRCTQFIVALLDRMADLDVSEELKTYADQQKEIAEDYLQAYALTDELITRYKVVWNPRRLSALSQAEVEALDEEIVELATRSQELLAHVGEKEQASQQYYTDSKLGEPATGGRSWVLWVISLGISSASALGCGIVARRKNRNIVGWGIFGFLIPIVALIAIQAVRKVEYRADPLAQPRL
jgi:hypothetical protein